MDTAQLWLTALLILAPPGLYTIGIVIYDTRRRARRRAGRPTTADISARIKAERQQEQQALQGEKSDSPHLPHGWHWPARDRDTRSGK